MSIELSRDELLVLYDLLHRLEDVEEIFEDPSEQEVLWHIQTQLEKELVEPFQADYQAIIEEARRAGTEQYRDGVKQTLLGGRTGGRTTGHPL